MKIYFLLLAMLVSSWLVSSCTMQTRYNLKKQKGAQTNFQQNSLITAPPLKENTPSFVKENTPSFAPKARDNTVIANMQNEIAQLNTVSEQLTEKINSLEKVILKLKAQSLKKLHIQNQKSTINKAAKQLIKKKEKRKKKKKLLGNFAQAQKDFQRKKWVSAIANYEKYRTLNPQGKNYALATYNIALSLEGLGLKEEAKSFYNEILDPKSPYFNSQLAKKIKTQQKKLSSKKAKKI